MLDDVLQRLPHETSTRVGLERVVAEVRRPKMATNDLADVDDTRDFIVVRDNQEPFAVFGADALDVPLEPRAVARRRDPPSMQVATAAHRAQEIRAPARRRRLEPRPIHGKTGFTLEP